MLHLGHIKLFPILQAFKGYSFSKFRADFWAGLNVALLDFPQAMAYALLIGFPVRFGVYASAIASIVGPIFASSRYVILGPTNATAVLVLSSFLTLELPPNQKFIALPLLLFMVGLFMVVGSFLKLAGLIKYVSRSVIVGYISAAAVLIVINQLSVLMNLHDINGGTVFDVLKTMVIHFQQTDFQSVAFAVLTAGIYFLNKRFLPQIPRVAATLILASFLAYGLKYFDVNISLIETIYDSKWPISIPKFSFELINQLGGAAMAVAFLAILESSSISSTLAARSGKRVDLNQQMFSMGLANLGCAFGSGIPVSGSLTRSTLNYKSGAVSGVSSIISGCFLVAGVLLLSPLIGFIPRPALSMMVILVGAQLIDFEAIKFTIKATRSDATVFYLTFIAGLLFPLNTAIYLGAAASIVLFLKKVSEPKLVEYAFTDKGELTEKDEKTQNIPEISIVHVEGELFFGSTEIFLDQMRLICESPNLKVIILRVRNAHNLDATSAMAIKDLVRFAHEKGRGIIISGANRQVERVFKEAGVMDLLGKENFFRYVHRNPNLSTRHALKRAQEMMGAEKANIILFAAPSKVEETQKQEESKPAEPSQSEDQQQPPLQLTK